MMADNLKASPQTLQQVGLTLTSKIQGDKLIVHGIRSKDETQYIGQLNSNNVDFEDIQELIEDNKKVKVFPISDNLIKIKVGPIPIQLIQRPKKQTQNYDTKTIKTLLQTQSLIEKQIEQHNTELQQHKTLINQLQMSFNDFKQTIKLGILSQEQLKEKVANLQSQTQERLTTKIESTFDKRFKELQQLVNKKRQSEKNDALNENKIEEMKNQINELKNQIAGLKLNQEDKMSLSLKVSQLEKPDMQEKMQQNAKKKQMIKLALNKKFESVSARLNANSILIDDLKRQLRKQNDALKKTQATFSEHNEKLNQHETKIQAISTTVTQQSNQLKQHSNQIKQISITVSQKSNQLKQHETKLNYLINYLQGKLGFQFQEMIRKLKKRQFELGLQISRLNEPIRSSKWSDQLKSKEITIKNNFVTKTKELTNQIIYYQQFCLLNASFSNTLKQKQSWAIKINKKTGLIDLGVCLKSKMIKCNFNTQNIEWCETGHGLYMISSSRFCFSHSLKEFSRVNKSFEFDCGDVIQIEYDPIESKLRFSKNKGDNYFEMPIIAPPQNDAYHPCVGLIRQNDSVQLLPQSQQK